MLFVRGDGVILVSPPLRVGLWTPKYENEHLILTSVWYFLSQKVIIL